MNNPRRLAAVVFTDIEGFSAMTAKDEQAALKHLEKFRHVVSSTTSAHGGQLIHFYGDGSLSMHSNTLDAVRCAIMMQREFRKGIPVPVRMGIHVGEIVKKDETIYGNAVNIASRVQSLGVPGSVLVTGVVENQLANHTGFHCKYLGRDYLKNIREVVKVFALQDDEGTLVIPEWSTIRKLNPARRKGQIYILPALLLLAVALFFLPRWLGRATTEIDGILSERILVMPFENATLDPELEEIGNIACHYLTSGLDNLPNVKVVSLHAILNQQLQQLFEYASKATFRKNTQASNIIEGQFFLDGEDLVFRSSLVNLQTDETLVSFPLIRTKKGEYLSGLQDLLKSMMGYWLSKDEMPLSIPTSDAYKAYSTGLSYWKVDFQKAEYYLRKAIQYDSSFLDAYFQLFDVFYQQMQYARCDSILNAVTTGFNEEQLTERQKVSYRFYEALMKGDRINTVKLYQSNYQEDPGELYRNTSMAILFLEYVNEPEKCLKVLAEIPFDSLDFFQCAYCLDRIDAAVVASLLMEDTAGVRKYLAYYPEQMEFQRHYEVQILAFALLGDTLHVNELLKSILDEGGVGNYREMLHNTVLNFMLTERQSYTEFYLDSAYQMYLDYKNTRYSDVLIRKGLYSDAKTYIHYMLGQYPDHNLLLYQMALVHASQNETDSALQIINKLEANKPDYDYGKIFYQQACIYSSMGDQENALKKVEEAVSAGRLFRYNRYRLDPDLKLLHDDPRFIQYTHPMRTD